MDFKFARLQDAHVRFNGLEWNKLVCRVNKYHLKSISLLMFIGSFGFIVIQNIATVEDGPWNNYGIDCKMVEKYMKGELEGDFKIQDVEIQIKHSLKSHEHGETIQSTFYHRPLLNCLKADDPHLTHVIREDLMLKPDKSITSYSIDNINAKELSSQHQAKDVMDMIFKEKRNGFFVEAGAFDCEFSVTLPLENHFGWTGILVEPVPSYFEYCKTVNRQSHLIQTCLGTKEKPYFTSFNFNSGNTVMMSNTTGFKTTAAFASEESDFNIELQCYPLYSLLLSLGNPTVNLFVLDIEGYELPVLESIPWDKVDIEVLDIETDLAGTIMKDSSKEKIISLMDSHGYDRFDHRNDYNPWTKKNQNDLFVRRDIVKKYNVKQLY